MREYSHRFRQAKIEGGAGADGGFEPDFAARVFDRVFDECQTKPGAGAFCSKVRFKYFFAQVIWDAVTIILYAEQNIFAGDQVVDLYQALPVSRDGFYGVFK